MKSIFFLKFVFIFLIVFLFGGITGCNGPKSSSNTKSSSNIEQEQHIKDSASLKKIFFDKSFSRQSLVSKQSYNVGVLYWSKTIGGQIAMSKGLEKEAKLINSRASEKGLPRIELDILIAGDGEKGIENQIVQMNSMIDKKKDIIIVQPTDIAALGDVLKKANQSFIPVVAYDQHIIGGFLHCYLTSDNYQAGYLDGEYVASHFSDDKSIKIILIEYPNVSSTVERVNGFIDALEELKQPFNIVKTYLAVDPDSGKKAGVNILMDFPEKGSFDVVFSINDGGGLNIIKALESAGRSEVFFASVDGDPGAIDIIRKKGILKIDSAQFCSELGAETMRSAYSILRGEKICKKKLIPVFPVTIETLDMFKGWSEPKPKAFKKFWPSKIPEWTGRVKKIDSNR